MQAAVRAASPLGNQGFFMGLANRLANRLAALAARRRRSGRGAGATRLSWESAAAVVESAAAVGASGRPWQQPSGDP